MARIRHVFVALAMLIAFYVATPVQSQDQTVGVFINEPGAYDGYTLFSANNNGTTYLIDNEGRQVHTWEGSAGLTTYLMDDGSILRPVFLGGNSRFVQSGGTGRVERIDWDGALVWEFVYSSADYRLHHDLELLPNVNVLMFAWEYKTSEEAIAAGRNPARLVDGEVWPEHIIEVEPTGASGGNIVWEWHVWDHLVQDFDAMKDNFGVVGDHPELVDVNFGPAGKDWQHANSIDYNPELDQIIFSLRSFDEFWVIDHSTTTAEAASHSGGNSGKGGDLLYRWGNPQAYDRGTAADRKFFLQHDAQWIEPGLPGAGNILIFNNGNGRPGGDASSVDELVPPVDASGNYFLPPGEPYGPPTLTWTYIGPPVFYAAFISGAVRLPNGNTLIDEGPQGILFEVTPAGEIVWQYVSPVSGAGPIPQGATSTDTDIFRAYKYPATHPGLAGRDLTPGERLESVADSDDDGLSDFEETETYSTDPFAADTDGDGLSDGDEVLVYDTDPLVSDMDGDGLSDGDEVLTYGTDPTLVDTDGDGFSDRDEIFIRGTDPLQAALLGDVNCDGDVSSIDAALILQLTAGVIPFLFCQESGDVNGDGNPTSVDAAIILQFTAGLIPSL